MFFSGPFFHIVGMGQWHDRPLGSCDMNSLLEKLVREVIKMPLGSKFALCVSTKHCPFFHCGSARRASMKENTSSVVGFIVVALYNTSTTCHYCCSKEDFKVVDKTLGKKSFLEDNFTFPWQVTMWRYFVWGEPLTSLPLIRKPASGTRASNGGRKISTKTVRKKRLLVVVIS